MGFGNPELPIMASFPELLILDFLHFFFSRVTNSGWKSEQKIIELVTLVVRVSNSRWMKNKTKIFNQITRMEKLIKTLDGKNKNKCL